MTDLQAALRALNNAAYAAIRAGADTETANFVARQLAVSGVAMIRRNADGTVSYIGAEEWMPDTLVDTEGREA